MKKLDTKTRKKQIIELSLEIIKQGGIQKLTMKEISRKVGISEQAIYRHFENKLDILLSIIRHFNKNFDILFAQLQQQKSAIQKLDHFFDIHFEYFSQTPSTSAVIFSEEIFQNEESLTIEVRKLIKKRIEIICQLVQEGQKSGEIKKKYDSENLAYMVLGALRFLVKNWHFSAYSFNLKERGESLKKDIIELISSN